MSSSTVKSRQYINGKNKQYKKLDYGNSDDLSVNLENSDALSTPNSWSEGRVKDEISSFIAEFSYLEDANEEKRPSQQNKPRISLQTYQLYPAHLEGNDTNEFLNPNKSKPHRKRSITFKEGQNSQLRPHERGRAKSRSFDIQDSNVEREMRRRSPRDHRVRGDDKHRLIREMPIRSNRTRSLSMKKRRTYRKQRPHSYHKSRSRSPVIHKEYPYYPSKRRTRTRSRDSQVKHIPLRYKRKKSRRRRIMPAFKTDVKTPITTPSIITLYPLNPNMREEIILPNNQEFFIDGHIACKCYKCMKKYKSLLKLSERRQRPSNKKFKTHRDPIKCQDWCYGECVQPWDQRDMCLNQSETEYEKKVFFKLNSYCQHVDSRITKYFHSILNRAPHECC